MRRRARVLAQALAGAGVVVGGARATAPAWAESRPSYAGKITASLTGEPRSFDPVAISGHDDSALVGLVFDSLYRVDADGSAVPSLAIAAPEVDPGQKLVRVRIRRGVVFSDGSALTAADVAASLERLQKSPAGWLLASVTSIRASGDDVVELGLSAGALVTVAGNPSTGAVPIAVALAQPQASITPRGAAPVAAKPIGSGSFVLAAIDRGNDRVRLVANDTHFAGRPYVDELELRWFDAADGDARRFETGDAQISLRGPTPFTGGQPRYRYRAVAGPVTVLTYVGFGAAHRAVTKSPAFRRALDLAIARPGFTGLGAGERILPTTQVVAGSDDAAAVARSGDAAAALAALGEAATAVPELAPAQRGALRLEIIVDKTQADDREVAERVARALDKLGITGVVTKLASDAYLKRLRKADYDLAIAQLDGPVAQPALWWAAAFALGDDDWARRQLAGGKLDLAAAPQRHAAQRPIIPLFRRGLQATVRTDLRGVGFDGLGRLGYCDGFVEGKPQPFKGPK